MSYSNELYHYGILGMKWGVRRYQNRDGTLTPEGKKRYSDDYNRVAEIRKKSVPEMSNAELREVNTRLQLENQYKNLTSSGNNHVNKLLGNLGTQASNKLTNAIVSYGFDKTSKAIASIDPKMGVAAVALKAVMEYNIHKK